ncbi:Cobalt-precorrin-8 methylmutase [Methanothermobacter wolfeii]|uniref:Cobalt-precorrin-8 methylmutase n=1 Tax=Methanothermobacter wolfeii TaxID=145261 RepID=A0A9E7RWD9_METWO|nr:MULTISPECIES: cobalt-precorrin-8 methylmutase [Methanothermobacter]NLM02795.1 cobalt-precorrin-8 methylmutase [Methanothermobacter wolfeii]QHN06140.1 cobalt-precorrin-8 methylmutase [Methanothermobacter sp. THM-1]UXH32597.1 cobalt-precorrin-8 methylmutase [Methanothermobacter wolfeii]SCM56671.1 Cobalt-precorrin-8 methylmutase [Methanothermobacter wolfeii]
MGASTGQGYEIARKSREIVRELIGNDIAGLGEEEAAIVERIVHSTADPEYARITRFSSDFVQAALGSLRESGSILTDIEMVRAGITGDRAVSFIRRPEVAEIAAGREITRAAAAVEYAAEKGFRGLIVIGNAPTALMKVIELVEDGSLDADAVIGVPVGFVGAAESKEALRRTELPHMITEGPKGGTPVAVAAANALIALSEGRKV